MAATDYASEQQVILGRLNDQWSGATDIAWPNSAYEPTGAEYIEPRVNRQEAFNADISPSNPRVRHPGLLTVTVRVPLDSGDGRAYDLADDIAAIFRNVYVSGVVFRAPTVRNARREGSWYRVQVDCPYQRDSIH